MHSLVVNDETNLLRLITPWLDNSCQIKPKRATTTFSQTFRELNTPHAAYGLDVLPFSWPFDDLAVAVHDNMLKMARDDQQKLLLLDPNTHFNGNKDKFAVTNEFSDRHLSLSITRPWDPGVLTSFCGNQHKANVFQQ